MSPFLEFQTISIPNLTKIGSPFFFCQTDNECTERVILFSIVWIDNVLTVWLELKTHSLTHKQNLKHSQNYEVADKYAFNCENLKI